MTTGIVMSLTDEQVGEIEARAKVATKGAWRVGEWMPRETVGRHQVVVDTDEGPYVILEGNQNFIDDANENAAFVAAANPAAILSIIADARRYRWLRSNAYGSMHYGELESLFGYNDDVIDEKIDAKIKASQ